MSSEDEDSHHRLGLPSRQAFDLPKIVFHGAIVGPRRNTLNTVPIRVRIASPRAQHLPADHSVARDAHVRLGPLRRRRADLHMDRAFLAAARAQDHGRSRG